MKMKTFVLVVIVLSLTNDIECKKNKKGKKKKSCQKQFKDCSDVYNAGFKKSGVYMVYPVNDQLLVYCDMDTDGGGWTVSQRRRDGSVSFDRNWIEYVSGFGDLKGEFWLGNNNLFTMTSPIKQRLRIDLEDFDGETAYAQYDDFTVAPESLKFKLSLGEYSGGNAGDSMKIHRNMFFSTKDNDNDENSGHCAWHGGGFWYASCFTNGLNLFYDEGKYRIFWRTWKGDDVYLKATSMMFRPMKFKP